MAKEPDPKDALLAWISRDDGLVPEMRELAVSAGYRVASEIRQVKDVPDPKYYFGSGKVSEFKGVEGVGSLLTPADLGSRFVYGSDWNRTE